LGKQGLAVDDLGRRAAAASTRAEGFDLVERQITTALHAINPPTDD
jgi:hypothetical protein